MRGFVARLTRRQTHLLFGAYSLGLAALNARALHGMVELSRRDATASHLLLVPVVTTLLIWLKREEVFRTIRSFGPFETGVFIVAGVVAWAAYTSALYDVRETSSTSIATVIVLWVTGFLFFYGQAAFRTVLFPILFLVFMVPIPSALLTWATSFLKWGSAEVVAGLFAMLGTPVYREGFVFALPKFTIEIADECSGIRSSIALLLTTLLAGEMFLKTGWKKALLVAIIIPLVVIKNGIRIVSLSLLGTYVDTSFITGKLHHEGGVVFYLIALAIMTPLLVRLRKAEHPLVPAVGGGHALSRFVNVYHHVFKVDDAVRGKKSARRLQ